MYLKEFFASLSGKYTDVDGAGSKTNKNQCVDVVKAYCNKVFGVPVSKMNGYGDAWQYYDNFSSKEDDNGSNPETIVIASFDASSLKLFALIEPSSRPFTKAFT